MCSDDHKDIQMGKKKDLDEKYLGQFTQNTLDMGRGFISCINNNICDYKAIAEDETMSTVEKAIAKRKVVAIDIGLGTLGTGSVLGMMWIAKKVFVA